MNIRYFQKGFNYSQDGPGNRLVYHLQGCGLRCPWCANPESFPADRGNVCDTCVLCQEAIKCHPMFFEGGGVTFTGGEPTFQFDALAEMLETLHNKGINTCIETNGSHERLPELFPYINHLLIDLKHPEPVKLLRVTGGKGTVINKNIRRACEEHPSVLIHIPYIHGFNDAPEDMKAFITFLRGIEGRFDVEVLPYHEYGKDKWIREGMEYKVENGFVKDETICIFQNLLSENGISVVRT